MSDNTQRPGMERHLQTIISAVALALMFWVFTEVQELTITVATQTVEITALRDQVSVGIDDRYRAKDATRDFSSRDRRMDAMERRIDRLEGRDP